MRKLLCKLFDLVPREAIMPVRPTKHPPFAFRDPKGVEYFAWEDFQQMPPARANEIDDILLQIDAGLSRNNLEAIATAIVEANQAGMQAKDAKEKGRAYHKVATLANELVMRPKHIVPEDCYFALAAVCAVRADEDPYAFDKTIQAEKMEAFRLAGRAGHDFFTQGGAFRRWLDVTRISESGLPILLLGWNYHRSKTEAVLRILS